MTTRKTATSRTVTRGTVPTRLTRAVTARGGSTERPVSDGPVKTKLSAKTVSKKPVGSSTQEKGIKAKVVVSNRVTLEDDREPIKAFLRIRPTFDGESPIDPYLQYIDAATVQMTDPSSRARSALQSNVFTFTHVFRPETSQSDFFSMTTLPLVRDLLYGQNGLIFTYGVTNSGKTYTIQGGSNPNTAGLLPRTLDVIFNSVDGLHSNVPYRPVKLASVERIQDENIHEVQAALPDITDEKAIADVFGESSTHGTDSTTLSVDRNYEYAIWIGYAEVYNEKIYDLLSSDSSEESGTILASPMTSNFPRSATHRKIPRSTSTWRSLAAMTTSSSSDVLQVKRKALTLKSDPDGGGKYVSDLRLIRVRNAEEAKRVFRTGNINRRVFGTLANAASSRSHGVFTVYSVRVHKGDHSDVNVSRLSIVDLAGSERSKNTQSSGERLKEAGNINKSLMVLGQCLEALRNNQRRMAASLATPGRGAIGGIRNDATFNAKLAIVPFRHSKLTELFQDFFVGEREGRAVMIVNVNPYDTGFDENSHVMRFSALAREVTTAPANPVQSPTKAKILEQKSRIPAPSTRKVTISANMKKGSKISEAHLEVVEEDEEDQDSGSEPMEPLVDALFEEIEELRIKLYESEMRCAIVEAETREEVMREMETRMLDMERTFSRRLMSALEQNEQKTDQKIDMLYQFGAFNGKAKGTYMHSDDEDEIYSEEDSRFTASIAVSEDASLGETREDSSYGSQSASFASSATPPSPLEASMFRKAASVQKVKQTGPAVIGLRDEDMAIDDIDADDTMTIDDETSEGDEDEDEDGTEPQEGSATEDDDWVPTREVSPQPKSEKAGAKGKKAISALRPLSMNQLQDGMKTLRIEDEQSSSDELNGSFGEGASHEETMPRKKSASLARKDTRTNPKPVRRSNRSSRKVNI